LNAMIAARALAPDVSTAKRGMAVATDTAPAIGRGRCCGTFGELVQGALPPDGRHFLISLPIARGSSALFSPEPGRPLCVQPGDRTKSRTLAERMLALHGLEPAGLLTVDCDLPVGKGMASSSADLVASARAVADAFGLEPTAEDIEDLIREIEPTDGVMYDGAVAYLYREVRLLAGLGPLPALTIVGMDEGGTVDTVEFNKKPKMFSSRQMGEYEFMFGEASDAVKCGDVWTLGRLATRSAELNQRFHPKRLFTRAVELSRQAGALGVVAAHSGTAVGVLLSDADPEYRVKLAHVFAACQRLCGTATIDYSVP
jgi:uncharacterized protein involved in propanediol utilization